jgi:hypothetical protein
MGNASMNRLVTSIGFNYTPKGERHLAPSSVEGLIPCILTGEGIDRPTTVYVRPGKVRKSIANYVDNKQTLCPPYHYDLDEEEPILEETAIPEELAIMPAPSSQPVKLLNKKARAVICLNDGKYYPSVKLAGIQYRVSGAHISCQLTGKTKQVKGYRFRFATDDEKVAASQTPSWRSTDERLPLVTGTRNF